MTNDGAICEALGCDKQAHSIIEVQVGQRGTVQLQVCRDCISKFAGVQCSYDLKENRMKSVDLFVTSQDRQMCGTQQSSLQEVLLDDG